MLASSNCVECRTQKNGDVAAPLGAVTRAKKVLRCARHIMVDAESAIS